ncbi:hypothetical protein SAMN05421664_2657 [Chryseobacterium soldanellicola]|uniref:Uncharacterized protein n=1 Tax=Chryseobacterium soldanellicola TaxID=311333 RepID=A0A1H1DW51_9FLAO|nr:hypothetical protein [Chryseobacterium soldanellicola]SDQ80458.1 hypothetical protein SAMN05421664_2657 [Chryseobacterium soldanellicola]
MIDLITQNKFEELKEVLQHSNNFKIYHYLLEILNGNTIEVDSETFDANKYQEEFFEGFEMYKALEKSDIDEIQLKKFSDLLVELTFKMGGFIQLMADNAMNKGVYLTDLADIYPVNPEIRTQLQEFIDILKNKPDEVKAVANLAATKAQISNSIGNILEKHQIGKDMLQFAECYEKAGQIEMTIRIYMGIMNDFECDSVKSSSGLFPEMTYVDDRPQSEIDIFNKAKINYERLTDHEIEEPKRTRVNENPVAENLVESVVNSMQNEVRPEKSTGFLEKIKKLFGKG